MSIVGSHCCEIHPRIDILGTPVSAIWPSKFLDLVDLRLDQGGGGYITVPDAFNIMLATQDEHLAAVHNGAFIVSPDGSPLTVVGRLQGHRRMRRVCGPDLLPLLCKNGVSKGVRHYFYGGAPGVAQAVAESLSRACPGLQVVGAESPPFRDITKEPDLEAARRIKAARPDIVWVGLGAPKQEYWIAANSPLLTDAILIGVGAAFDFQSGRVARAPRWVQYAGLEWAFRFLQEPTRLWRRYLVAAPSFFFRAAGQIIRSRFV